MHYSAFLFPYWTVVSLYNVSYGMIIAKALELGYCCIWSESVIELWVNSINFIYGNHFSIILPRFAPRRQYTM